MADKLKCPMCGKMNAHTGGYAFCTKCRMAYDDEPDEGGNPSSNNPVASAIGKEEFLARQKERRRGRRWR